MTNSMATADPGVDPVALLAAVARGLEATEASIIRLQAVKEGFLAVAHRIADDLAAVDAQEHGNGTSAELSHRSVAAELAAVLHMSDRVVQGRMSQAAELVNRFPETMRALSDARIGLPHARQIQDAGARLTEDDVRATFEQIAVVASEGETPHRAKAVVQRAAERLAPRSLTARHREAQERRRVWREDLGDGQMALGLIHSAAIIDGIYDRLSQQAFAVKTANARATKDPAAGPDSDAGTFGDPSDERSIDQLRADLCADTLLTGAPLGHDTTAGLLAAIQGRVEVTVPVLTLITATADPRAASAPEQPGELAGGAPIDADTARILAGGVAGWERVLTHPLTGAILAVDRYRPTADLRRLLHARDSRCRFPTCGLPPVAHDLDHTIDAAYGGPTAEGNLGGLCRRHHVLKHQTAWSVVQRGGGVLEWTSPAGLCYVDTPPSPVTFTIEDPDPPPDRNLPPDGIPPF